MTATSPIHGLPRGSDQTPNEGQKTEIQI